MNPLTKKLLIINIVIATLLALAICTRANARDIGSIFFKMELSDRWAEMPKVGKVTSYSHLDEKGKPDGPMLFIIRNFIEEREKFTFEHYLEHSTPWSVLSHSIKEWPRPVVLWEVIKTSSEVKMGNTFGHRIEVVVRDGLVGRYRIMLWYTTLHKGNYFHFQFYASLENYEKLKKEMEKVISSFKIIANPFGKALPHDK